jgi:hypothetical protein
MQLNDEEDEKVPDPFYSDQRLYDGIKKLFDVKSEELQKVFD